MSTPVLLFIFAIILIIVIVGFMVYIGSLSNSLPPLYKQCDVYDKLLNNHIMLKNVHTGNVIGSDFNSDKIFTYNSGITKFKYDGESLKISNEEGETRTLNPIKLLLLEANPLVVYIKMNNSYLTDDQNGDISIVPEPTSLSKWRAIPVAAPIAGVEKSDNYRMEAV